MYGVFQDRDDFHTFMPMNDLYYKYYNEYPKNECADSGYGMYDNYKYMKEHNIGNYVKHVTWSGEEVSFKWIRHPRYKNSKLYKFTGCDICNYSYICKKI